MTEEEEEEIISIIQPCVMWAQNGPTCLQPKNFQITTKVHLLDRACTLRRGKETDVTNSDVMHKM